MKHTFIAADGSEKTVNISDEILAQGRTEGLSVKETIERYLSDEGYIVNEVVAELTSKAKGAGVNGAGRVAGDKKKRKAPTRKPDYTKRAIIAVLADALIDIEGVVPQSIQVTNIERMIAFSFGDDKYEVTLSKKRKPKK